MQSCAHLSVYVFLLLLINSTCSTTSKISSSGLLLFEQAAGEHRKKYDELVKTQEQLKIDRDTFEEMKRQMQRSVDKTDVLRLNVGGELMMTTRETLTRVSKSVLATMFNGRWEHKFGNDQDGNIFLDFNPMLFRHLLDQLRMSNNDDPIRFHPPSSASLLVPFEKMLRKLGLDPSPKSAEAVITLDVAGDIVTTRNKTLIGALNWKFLTHVSSSNTTSVVADGNLFLDFTPKLFRHLLRQLREEKTNTSGFSAPSNEEKDAFNAMLSDFNLNKATNTPRGRRYHPNDDLTRGFNDSFSTNVQTEASDVRSLSDYPEDCAAIYLVTKNAQNQPPKSGIYLICPEQGKPIKVLCDMETDGGGWTVFQKRGDFVPQEDFYRTWLEYKRGFGDLQREFWLGNDPLSLLTNQDEYQLRVDLEDFDRQKRFAQYDAVRVSNEQDKYRLTYKSYLNGDAGDSLGGNGMQFSTKDQDNDMNSGSCAQIYNGAWWYGACHVSNLNGGYLRGNHPTIYAAGVNWVTFRGYHYSIKSTEMKLRPVSFKP